MRIFQIFFILALSTIIACQAEKCCQGSRSFFVPRSVTHNSTYELALTNYHIFAEENCSNAYFFAAPFYQQTSKASDFARYFLYHNQESVTFSDSGLADVNSLWFNVISAPGTFYNSTVSIRPTRKVAGGYFYGWFNFGQLLDCDRWNLSNMWLSVNFAAFQAKHNLNVCETPSAAPGTIPGFASITQALNNPEWRAGRWNRCSMHRSGVDDIQIKLGYTLYPSECVNHVAFYLVGTIPTGNIPSNLFLFEPYVGTRFGALGVGLNGSIDWDICNQDLTFMFDVKYRHLFQGKNCRSFDLCANGDWSRYLQVVTSEQPFFSQPGINAFTLPINVDPGNELQVWAAVHGCWCSLNWELGYNLWWRQEEDLNFRGCNFPPVGIYDITGSCNLNPISASQATISQGPVPPNQAPSDAVFTPVVINNLNRKSASAPSVLTNTLYGAIEYGACICDYETDLGLLGSYEFGQDCKGAPSQWSIMVKLGLGF